MVKLKVVQPSPVVACRNADCSMMHKVLLVAVRSHVSAPLKDSVDQQIHTEASRVVSVEYIPAAPLMRGPRWLHVRRIYQHHRERRLLNSRRELSVTSLNAVLKPLQHIAYRCENDKIAFIHLLVYVEPHSMAAMLKIFVQCPFVYLRHIISPTC